MNRRVTAAAAAIAGAAMIATPLARRGGVSRQRLAHVVIGGLLATTASSAARTWGPARAAGTITAVAGGTAAVEYVGLHTGLPFGRYRYTAALGRRLAGVPPLVPLAWAAMAIPARDAAAAALGPRGGTLGRVALGAAALTAWDLYLDPQMVAEGYWEWQRTGAYRGIPATNFGGWLVTSAAVMALLERTLPPRRGDTTQIVTYAAVVAMETVAFAWFFRDRLVATVGAAASLPIAAVALARSVSRTTTAGRHW